MPRGGNVTSTSQVPLPVVFLLGPSGSGKTTLGEALASQRRFLHLNLDRLGADAVKLAGLRGEWDAFLAGRSNALVDAVQNRAVQARCVGAVLSFPSGVLFVLPPERIRAIIKDGITTVLLFGSAAECREAFIENEGLARRVEGDLVAHWNLNNESLHHALEAPEYDFIRLSTFKAEKRRPVDDLVTEVLRRLGS